MSIKRLNTDLDDRLEINKNLASFLKKPKNLEHEKDKREDDCFQSGIKLSNKNISLSENKIHRNFDDLTIDTKEELLLLDEEKYTNSNMASDSDADRLIEEMDNILKNSRYKSLSPQLKNSSSSKTDSRVIEKNQLNSNVNIISNNNKSILSNKSINASDSLGYHSFQSDYNNSSSWFSTENNSKLGFKEHSIKEIEETENDSKNKSVIEIKSDENDDDDDDDGDIIYCYTDSSDLSESSPLIISLSSSNEDIQIDQQKSEEDQDLTSIHKNIKIGTVKPNNMLESNNSENSNEISTNESKFLAGIPDNNINLINLNSTQLNQFEMIQPSPSLIKFKNLKKRKSRNCRRHLGKIKHASYLKLIKNLNKQPQNLEDDDSLESGEIIIPSSSSTLIANELVSTNQSHNLIQINENSGILQLNNRHLIDDTKKRRVKFNDFKKINFISAGIHQNSHLNSTNLFRSYVRNNLQNTREQQRQLQNLSENIGGKILLKMGYEVGKGLGKRLQGINMPIETFGRSCIRSLYNEMGLPTSNNIVEKQYNILKALGSFQLKDTQSTYKSVPGIYSSVPFDYSQLPNPFDIQIPNNQKNLKIFDYYHEQNYNDNNELQKNATGSKDQLSNILVEIINDNENSQNLKCNNDQMNFNDNSETINSNESPKTSRKSPQKHFQLNISRKNGSLLYDQLNLLQQKLEKHALNSVKMSNICLQFESVLIIDDYLRINCTNEITYEWLDNLITTSTTRKFLPGIKLIVNKSDSSALLHKIRTFIPDGSRTTMEYFKLLEIQNPGIKTKKWKIYFKNYVKDGVHLVLGITDKSYKILEKVYKFRPYLGLHRIQINIVDPIIEN